jgi:hypothetical protein
MHIFYSTDCKDKYVISDLFAGFNVWCLTDHSRNYHITEEIYNTPGLKKMDSADLTLDEFKYYCHLLCDVLGEYGDFALCIQKNNPDKQIYDHAFPDLDY